VHEIGYGVIAHRAEHAPRRVDVVANERLGKFTGDLRMQLHDTHRAIETVLPISRFGKIGEYGFHIRMQFLQDAQVVRVLVDRHDSRVAACLELDDQVLADESGRAGQDDLGVFGNHRLRA
jgi:hypothetical protein